MPDSTMHCSETPATIRRPPSLLDEHTTEVLSEYGYTESDFERLREEEVV